MPITLKLVRSTPATLIAALTLTLALCLTAAVTWAAPAPQKTTEPDFAAIDAYVETQMKELRIPGLVLGIVQGDQIVHLKSFGIADPSGRPVTSQTPFIVGSLNKPITCLAVMQLAEQGKIDLDVPVQRYIPWFRIADEAASAQITVRHLLLQTSGIDTSAGYANARDTDASDEAIEQRVRAMRSFELAHPVGTTFAYSNDSFIVLALLIQQVTGQSYNDYLKEHVFAPLQMGHSSASQPEAKRQGMATGYRHWFGLPFPADLPWNRGQIMLYSSSEDLAHYLIAQLNAGYFSTASVLSPQGIAELQRPANREGTDDVFWGMGWEVSQKLGMPMLYKNGDEANFHGDLILLPETRFGVVLLTNAPRALASYYGDRPVTMIALSVANLLAGQQPIAFTSRVPLLIYGALLLVMTVQVILCIRAVMLLRQWRSQRELRPRGASSLVRRVALPLLLSIAWGYLTLFGVSQFVGAPLSFLTYLWPDVGYTLLLSGLLALGWGLLSALLTTLVLHEGKPPAPTLIQEPAKV